MNISKKEIASVLGLLGLSNGLQGFGDSGGAISPELLTQLTQALPLPYLVAGGFVIYLLIPKQSKNQDKEIICSTCKATIGVEQDKAK